MEKIYILINKVNKIMITVPEDYFKNNYDDKSNTLVFADYHDKKIVFNLDDFDILVRRKGFKF